MTSLKRLAMLVLPPGVVAILKALRARATDLRLFGWTWQWEAVPDSASVWSSHDGWDHQSIADMQKAKWSAFLASVEGTGPVGQSHEAGIGAPVDVGVHNTIMTFAYVLGRIAGSGARVSVLDWGGGAGHYYVYARKLLPDVALDYVVKDLPTLCRVGQELLPDVTFTSNDAQSLSRRYDLVFASSSVHYTRDCYGLLDRLCASAGTWLMVTRLPVVEKSDDFVVVQRPHAFGYLTEYAGWFVNKHRLVKFITSRGFSLDREFIIDEEPYVRNAPEQGSYRGFLFRRTTMVSPGRKDE